MLYSLFCCRLTDHKSIQIGCTINCEKSIQQQYNMENDLPSNDNIHCIAV